MIKVIIPASGSGTRMGATMPKQFIELAGQPILKRTIAAFQNMDIVDEIIVTVPGGYVQTVAAYGFSKVRNVLDGSHCQTRASSVKLALDTLPANTEIVLIHDGVRPFVTSELVQSVTDAARLNGAAVACVPVTDTIKKAGDNSFITETIDRNQLYSAQTPQGFTYDLIINAYHEAENDDVLHQCTDDSMLVERLGKPVQTVPSSKKNIKITTAEDLIVAESFIKNAATPHLCGGRHCEPAKQSKICTLDCFGNGTLAMTGEHSSPLQNHTFYSSFLAHKNEAPQKNATPPVAAKPKTLSQRVTIFTDGACSGNPGPGGYGVVMMLGEHKKELSGGEAETTNNRMEIMGVIIGLESLNKPCEVDLYSDSRYVVDAIEKGWVVRWRQNNWMRNKKDPALNVDLWQRLLPLLDKHKVTFHWVKGHAGHPENERCDELARNAISDLI